MTAVAACRIAIERGPLIPDRGHFRFGRRLFSRATVAAARANGGKPLPEERTSHLRIVMSEEEIESVKTIAAEEDRTLPNMVRRLVKEALKARSEREKS